VGPGFEGHFWNEKRMFPKMEGGGDCNHTKCNLNNIFHKGKGYFATGEWAFFVFFQGTDNCNHKKWNLNNIFHEGKGHFATGERPGTFYVF
jgi:hypothetical protein